MQEIKGILFEPVGCLAEFPADPFLEMSARLSGRKRQTSRSGSRAYWHCLNLTADFRDPALEALELEAVNRASLYEDVLPSLGELESMGVKRLIASSLSQAAIACFLTACAHRFDGVWSRDNADGVKTAPLIRALDAAGIRPEQAMFLTDTAEGLKVARSVGVNAILMMNDPDESRRLAAHNPAGGIVSLHELPDFIRLLRAEHGSARR